MPMTLTFARIYPNDPAVQRAFVARDNDGARVLIVVEWAAKLAELMHQRRAAYPDKDCPLSLERFSAAAHFALARLDNGLELDGATVEV